MVLPLIPLALIAVGAVTGGGGLALGGKAALDIKNAQSQLNVAAKRYELRRTQCEARVVETNEILESLGAQQQQALTKVVVRMVEFLRRNAKQVRDNERLLVEGIDASVSEVQNLAGLDINAAAWIGGVIGSAAAGAGTSAGVGAVVTAVGAASTGTAISGLSGVAATNASLAFLGGGSLAAGGGGMALGAAALNFVTIGPALLVGGLVAHTQGDKARTKAREVSAQVAVEVAKMDELSAKLTAVDTRVQELSLILSDLGGRAVVALDELESEPFSAKAHAERFQRAMTLTMAVRDVAAAPILDAEGELTDESALLTVKYRPMTESDHDA